MKFVIAAFIAVLIVSNLNAQKVKIKSETVLVDDSDFVKIKKEFGKKIISTKSGTEFIALETANIDIPNPARNNMNDPARYNYPATLKQFYFIVKFLSFNLSFETDISEKNFLLALYKNEVIDTLGNIDEKKAKLMAQKISKNISGKAPIIIINN